MTTERQHELSTQCWCRPEVEEDPDWARRIHEEDLLLDERSTQLDTQSDPSTSPGEGQ